MGVNEFSSDLPIRFDVTSQTAARLHSSRKPKDTLARGVIKREKWLFKTPRLIGNSLRCNQDSRSASAAFKK